LEQNWRTKIGASTKIIVVIAVLIAVALGVTGFFLLMG
jgi:hypothetical protein